MMKNKNRLLNIWAKKQNSMAWSRTTDSAHEQESTKEKGDEDCVPSTQCDIIKSGPIH